MGVETGSETTSHSTKGVSAGSGSAGVSREALDFDLGFLPCVQFDAATAFCTRPRTPAKSFIIRGGMNTRTGVEMLHALIGR
jgi:hypothetical protein